MDTAQVHTQLGWSDERLLYTVNTFNNRAAAGGADPAAGVDPLQRPRPRLRLHPRHQHPPHQEPPQTQASVPGTRSLFILGQPTVRAVWNRVSGKELWIL